MKQLIAVLVVLLALTSPVFANGKYYLSDIAGSGTPEDPYWYIAGAIANQEECNTVWNAGYVGTPPHPWVLLYVDDCMDYTSFLGYTEINKIPDFNIHTKLSAMSPMAKADIEAIFTARGTPLSCFENSVCYAEMLNCVCQLVPGFSTCDVTAWGDY